MNDNLLTIKEAAKILNIHWQSVRNHIKSGKLKGFKVGKSVRISRNDIDAFIRAESEKQHLKEYEQRYLVNDKKTIKQNLLNLNAKLIYLSHVVDHWYFMDHIKSQEDNDNWFDSAKGFGARIRVEKNEYSNTPITTFEVKRLVSPHDHSYCIESEIKVSSVEEIDRVLRNMNLRQCLLIDKQREIYELDGYKICIDDIKDFGCGIEIEYKVKDLNDKVKEGVTDMAHKLGLKDNEKYEKTITREAMKKLAKF